MSQELLLTRKPRRTFGSTQDTDSTRLAWSFTRNEFILREMSIGGGIAWSRDIPVLGPQEERLRYDIGVAHIRRLGRRLSRILAYDYRLEELNTEAEKLDEHRLILSFIYAF